MCVKQCLSSNQDADDCIARFRRRVIKEGRRDRDDLINLFTVIRADNPVAFSCTFPYAFPYTSPRVLWFQYCEELNDANLVKQRLFNHVERLKEYGDDTKVLVITPGSSGV